MAIDGERIDDGIDRQMARINFQQPATVAATGLMALKSLRQGNEADEGQLVVATVARMKVARKTVKRTVMRKLLKSVIVLSLFSVWAEQSSCTFDPNPGEHFQQEVEHLQTLTIPPDSQLVDRHPTAIQRFGARANWEFQTSYSADAYNSWVAEKLRPDFQPYGSPKSPARFRKYDRGETENLSIAAAPSDGTTRVTITLEIYPD